MTPEDFAAPPVLRRLRIWKPNGTGGGTINMIAAHRVGWVFRQKPVKSYNETSWGFEVETLRLPGEALLALEDAGAKGFQFTELWTRPARPGEGEGPWREPPITASRRKMDAEVEKAQRRSES